MTQKLRLPANVEILSHTEPMTAESEKLQELGVAVHGQSFANPAEYENLARNYPMKKNGMFNIGLLHTSLNGAEGHEPYAQCTITDLRQKEYDYWALGHVHNREVKHEEPPILFPGNIQGRHIRETGEKGCYVVEVDDRGSVCYEFHPLDVFRWEQCELAADGAERADEVIDRFASELSELMKRHDGMPLAVRVEVTGRCQAHGQLMTDLVRWTNEIRATAISVGAGRAWVEKVKFHTRPLQKIDPDSMDDGPTDELIQYCRELCADEEQLQELSKELDPLWKKLPDDLRQGEDRLDLSDPDYLRELLEEVQPMLDSRLRGEVER